MADRRGVLLLFFDLPSKTKEEIKKANAFKKDLKKNGYQMLQESIYIKLFHNSCNIFAELVWLKGVVPKEGVIQTLKLSLQTFQQMNTLVGTPFNFELFASDYIVI